MTTLAWLSTQRRQSTAQPRCDTRRPLRARALATRFGATDVHSDALNTQAASRSAKGLDWAGQMRRALDIALAGSHHHEAGRAYTNLSGIHAGKREFAEAERYLEPGIAFCDEHDITTFAICLRGEHANVLERTSRWDEAVALTRERPFGLTRREYEVLDLICAERTNG